MRKFLYLVLFVMTLCVFCCSCSQKTNDVKKTSSQHEKKLKSVPNNTKEDVISEEDLEKGYDLPVSAQENEEAISLTDKTFPGVNELFSSPARADGHQKWIDFVMTFWHCDCVFLVVGIVAVAKCNIIALTTEYGRHNFKCFIMFGNKLFVFA